MTVTPPYIEPKTLIRGEKLHWRKSFDDYSSALYTLQYRFRSPLGLGIDADASAYGSDFNVEVPAADTATLSDGELYWQAWLTEIADSDNKFIVGSGTMKVKRGFIESGTNPVDLRSTNEKIFAALEATIAGKATKDQLSYRIESGNGAREIRRLTWDELLKARKEFAILVNREKNSGGGSAFKNYEIRSKEY